MIVVAAVAYALVPADLTPRASSDEGTVEAMEVLGVVQSILSDAAMFCDRNPKVCEIGRSIIFQVNEPTQSTTDEFAEPKEISQSAENAPEPIVAAPEN